MFEIASLLWGTVLLRPYVFVFLAAYLLSAVFFIGPKRTLIFTLLAYTIALLSELSSTRTGFPYGYYYYIESTRNQELWIFNVPFMDSLSYTFLSFISYNVAVLIKAPLERIGSDLRVVDTRQIRSGIDIAFLGAILFMLLDVVIDPVTLRGHRWFLGQIYGYPQLGAHFGVPLSNYAGWFFVGFITIAIYQRIDGWLTRKKVCLEPQLSFRIPSVTCFGFFIYIGVAVFNLGVTFWIGEANIAWCGVFIMAPLIILIFLTGMVWKPHATQVDWDLHFKDFPNSPFKKKPPN